MLLLRGVGEPGSEGGEAGNAVAMALRIVEVVFEVPEAKGDDARRWKLG